MNFIAKTKETTGVLQIEATANQNVRKKAGKTNEELFFLAKVRRVEEVEEGRGPYCRFSPSCQRDKYMPDNILAKAKFYWPVYIPSDALWDGHNLAEKRFSFINNR